MIKIDRIDCQIVELLMEDGRLTAAEIARMIGGISERVVRYRLERMLGDGLIEVRALVSPKALGLSVVAEVSIEVETGRVDEVAQHLAEYEFISYVATSIGERDISVRIISDSNAQVYSFVTEIIGKIPGVRKTTTSIVPRTLKDIYHWGIPGGVCQEVDAREPRP
jgi:Lrp/AsnC family transcriptional regulator for asnA, asnC and gidA